MPLPIASDHTLACPRTGLLARRAKVVELAWIRVAREAVGPEGHIVPQPWLAHTTAPRVEPTDRRRLDLLIYGATLSGIAFAVDANRPAAAMRRRCRRSRAARCRGRKRATYPKLAAAGPQRLIVLGAEVGGRWNGGALGLVRDLVRVCAFRAPPAVRRAARSGWARRWWSILSVAVRMATVQAQGSLPAREAAGNERRPSARRSLSLNAAPSTSAALASERDRRLATVWAAAKQTSAD